MILEQVFHSRSLLQFLMNSIRCYVIGWNTLSTLRFLFNFIHSIVDVSAPWLVWLSSHPSLLHTSVDCFAFSSFWFSSFNCLILLRHYRPQSFVLRSCLLRSIQHPSFSCSFNGIFLFGTATVTKICTFSFYSIFTGLLFSSRISSLFLIPNIINPIIVDRMYIEKEASKFN